jgi:alpha-amylase/alpha-mannosidase (GH57 family)
MIGPIFTSPWKPRDSVGKKFLLQLPQRESPNGRAQLREGATLPAPKRFVCIHGHFYQPPRENPWLETIETQDSAAPYHDWNERICAECYATNGAARVVNKENEITRIVNNYARMSFNFGPTLLSWVAENAPRTYRMILDGERRSRDLFQGHSSAMAQVYNHMIMPLANRRDRLTQIRWGISDYRHRFGHAPEGMWLAETAADTETLELLATEGIRFTVLAPRQCKRVRAIAGGRVGKDTGKPAGEWIDSPNAMVDPTHPYLIRFASGTSLAVFFYDGPTSRAIAFEGLLNSGEGFVARLKQGFLDNNQPQLVHVATDGESYGHHHRHGEMALAYALRLMEQDKNARLINYGNFLEQFPPQWEAEIYDNSSWSCDHGVERWRSNCGCNGGKVGWNQLWRAPLREALDRLRDSLVPLTEKAGNALFRDVWEARDAYISVILDRTQENVDRYFIDHQNHPLSDAERVRALELMEMQRHAQLMYTSCGWFFDDISGIETVQIIAYAARVIQLAQELFLTDAAGIEAAFLDKLAQAKSNVPSAGDGAKIYTQQCLNMELGLEQVAAHYAISSVFSSFADETEIFCYRINRISYEIFNSGRGRLALGRTRVTSSITGQTQSFSFAVLHFGDQNITAAVKAYDQEDVADAEAFVKVATQAREQVRNANFPEVIRLLDRYYDLDYSLTSLFRDEQRRILQIILNSTLADIEASLKNIYDDHASLLHYLSQAGLPKPPALALAAGFAVNAGLRRALEADPIDITLVRSFLAMAKADEVPLDTPTLTYVADLRMKRAMIELTMSSGNLEILDRALSLARTFTELPFELNLWQAQNIWYEILRSSSYSLTAHDPEDRPRWDRDFRELGCCLSIACDVISAEEPVPTAAD